MNENKCVKSVCIHTMDEYVLYSIDGRDENNLIIRIKEDVYYINKIDGMIDTLHISNHVGGKIKSDDVGLRCTRISTCSVDGMLTKRPENNGYELVNTVISNISNRDISMRIARDLNKFYQPYINTLLNNGSRLLKWIDNYETSLLVVERCDDVDLYNISINIKLACSLGVDAKRLKDAIKFITSRKEFLSVISGVDGVELNRNPIIYPRNIPDDKRM